MTLAETTIWILQSLQVWRDSWQFMFISDIRDLWLTTKRVVAVVISVWRLTDFFLLGVMSFARYFATD